MSRSKHKRVPRKNETKRFGFKMHMASYIRLNEDAEAEETSMSTLVNRIIDKHYGHEILPESRNTTTITRVM